MIVFRHFYEKDILSLRNEQFMSTDSYNHFHAIARAKQRTTVNHRVQMRIKMPFHFCGNSTPQYNEKMTLWMMSLFFFQVD